MKTKISLIFMLMLIIISKETYAYTEGFRYMIQELEIPEKNINGLMLNEDIYDKYNIIVYGSAKDIKNGQRWKEVSNGNWIYNTGLYKNETNVIRGEYWILGENVDGREVHNEIFPDDYVTSVSPLEWNYVEISDAEKSWLDTSSYHSEKQIEYMLKQNLSRKGITYDITAEKIGINKARLETYATWKTSGSIYTKKYGPNNMYWGATFNVPPLATEAKLNSYLYFAKGTSYKFSDECDKIKISISYGAIIDGLTEYVTKEDIKNIKTELLIDGKKVKSTSTKEEINLDDCYLLEVSKEDCKSNVLEILVTCNSVAETYFNLDTPMYSSKEEILTIYLNEEIEKIIVNNVNKRYQSGDKPKIASIEIKRITTNSKGEESYTNLDVAKKTDKNFILAGQVIYIRVTTLNDTQSVTLEIEGDKSITTFDELTQKFEWTEAKERGIKTRYKSLQDFKNTYKMPLKLKLEEDLGGGEKVFSTIYVVPYKTKQTLESWSTLREKTRDAFSIDENKIFERLDLPYSLVLKAKSEIGVTTKRKELDVFESWNTIYNRDLSKYVK